MVTFLSTCGNAEGGQYLARVVLLASHIDTGLLGFYDKSCHSLKDVGLLTPLPTSLLTYLPQYY